MLCNQGLWDGWACRLDHFEELNVYMRILSTLIEWHRLRGRTSYWFALRQRQQLDCCEYGNEISGIIKHDGFCYYPRNCWLLKQDPVPWSRLGKLVPYIPSRYKGSLEVKLHSFSTSDLDEGERSTSSYGSFIPGKTPRFPWEYSLVGPQSRSGLVWWWDNLQSGREFQFFSDHPLALLLHRLCYHDPWS
jgi:hypothetical protein